MKSCKKTLLVGLFFLGHNYAWSQNLEKSTDHRWYVGAQLASHYYAVVFPSGLPSIANPGPIQGNIGYQMSPRWSVQISGLHRWRKINSVGTGTTEAGETTTTEFSQDSWNTAIPITLRYTLTRQKDHRLQIDGALGIAFAKAHFNSRRIYSVNGKVEQEYSQNQKTSNSYLTGGISAQLAIDKSRKINIVMDLLLNRSNENLGKNTYKYLNSPVGLTRAYGIGIRYSFL